MTTHMIGTREEWLAARLRLLKEEKELTRRSDELARRRQQLPWVRIDKEYVFDTDEGEQALRELLPDARSSSSPLHVRARLQGGMSVLLGDRGRVQRHRRSSGEPRRHALGGVAGAAREAAGVQAADGVDVSVGVFARQRLQPRLQRLRIRRSNGARGFEYNYRREAVFEWRAGQEGGGAGAEAEFAAMCGTDAATYHRDRPGMSAIALEDGVVYHTYSAYARGVDGIWGMYQWLDRAPKGRNETSVWWRRHDEYDQR